MDKFRRIFYKFFVNGLDKGRGLLREKTSDHRAERVKEFKEMMYVDDM